jgi:crotonobetaine/carnitine-CoA ligase
MRLDELFARVLARAASLSAAGIRPRDRVLVCLPNSVDWIVSTLAVMRLGAIAAPIDPAATSREIDLYEQIIGPAGVIADPGRADSPFRAPPLPWREANPASILDPPPRAQDRALILFTSGTTGRPKAAVLRHSTLVHSGEGFAHWVGLTPADRLLFCMPLFHANAIYYSLMGAFCAGASMVILPRFSVSRFWESIRASRATQVNLMGPMVSMLLRQPETPDEGHNPLRLVYTAAVAPDAARAFMRRFRVEIVEGYGMTETPYGCVNPISRPKWGSVGLARQHPSGAFANEVKIAGANGAPAPNGQVGEIVIRNEATFLEYWGDPAATQAVFADGWLRTGDLGYRDDEGYFYIVGRVKEIIRRKGVNISPAEVESLMRDVPGIVDAALVGVPSALGEELAILAVTLTEAESADGIEDRVLSRLRSLLSREKVPDRVIVVDGIPRTRTQRVERGKLRECLQQSAGLGPAAERR